MGCLWELEAQPCISHHDSSTRASRVSLSGLSLTAFCTKFECHPALSTQSRVQPATERARGDPLAVAAARLGPNKLLRPSRARLRPAVWPQHTADGHLLDVKQRHLSLGADASRARRISACSSCKTGSWCPWLAERGARAHQLAVEFFDAARGGQRRFPERLLNSARFGASVHPW